MCNGFAILIPFVILSSPEVDQSSSKAENQVSSRSCKMLNSAKYIFLNTP